MLVLRGDALAVLSSLQSLRSLDLLLDKVGGWVVEAPASTCMHAWLAG